MACFRPLAAYRTSSGDITFDRRQGDTELTLPCGACVGCRVARARSWSLRCVHEASLHKLNCFVTLTYAPERVPPGGSLRYRDFQLFMKRLRKSSKVRVRFFVCGEYGEQLERPHYHACLFGYDFSDKKPVSYLASQNKSWRSSTLERLWGHGFCHLGELNVRSAGYAARYVLKKVTGVAGDAHYRRVLPTGEVVDLTPEFARMSLRPGIASAWFSKFQSDVTQFDYVVHEGKKFSVPKYYDKLLDQRDPALLASWKEDRELRALPFRPEGAPARLLVRETVEAARISTMKRNFES
ncbi:MAG: replication initiator protein [Microvirus sp.]|nr:MAG: replication initiator protein [Microvirus sp.]